MRSRKNDSSRPLLRRQHLANRGKRSKLSVELLEPRLNLALDVPAFSSLPGANHTIYLDFDGHVTSGTAWNSGATINSPPYSSDADTANFSASELQVIERTFQRVSEDFAPFQVNVTTVAPSVDDLRNTGGTDTKWGVRVVVTRDVAFSCGCGGIAYIDSFDWNSDTPAFVFNTGEVGVAEAVSHEVGHSLGLAHDGTATSSYYQGHGLGTDSNYWSTIMGVGYYVDVSQWDTGEYTGSNNTGTGANYGKGADDLAVITNYNGFGYKADDHGNTLATATTLTPVGTSLSGSGLITTRTDVDYFRFNTGGGNVTLNFSPAAVGANLDIEASLYNSAGVLVASSNPLQSLNASISATVSAGEYFIKIDGVGAGTPTAATPTGYSDYGSIGAYTISGTVTAATGGSLSIAATSASKNEGQTGSTPFTFTVTRSGDTSVQATVNYAVLGAEVGPADGADFVGGAYPTGSLTFDPGITTQVITINVQGDTAFESNESFVVRLQGASANTTIATSSAVGTIINDDASPLPPTLAISATNANKAEGTGSAATPFVFTVTRSGDLSASSSVRYTVSGSGTNRANSNDFVGGFPTNVAVNFAPGIASVDVSINVRADSTRESNETFRVTLSSAVGATISTSFATGTIRNDDATGAANGDSESPLIEMIAVADPLWMFVPAGNLTADELAVPVMTWIDGVPHIGDLAHDHDDEFGHDHDLGDDFDSLQTSLDFDSGLQRLNALRSTVVTTNSNQSADDANSELDFDSLFIDQAGDNLDFGLSVADTSVDHDAAFESELDSIDALLGDSDEAWTSLKSTI